MTLRPPSSGSGQRAQPPGAVERWQPMWLNMCMCVVAQCVPQERRTRRGVPTVTTCRSSTSPQVSARESNITNCGALQPRRSRARSRHGRHSASGRGPKSCDAQTRGGREMERSTAHSGGCQKVRRTSTSPPLGNSDSYAPRHTSLSSASSRVFWQTLASEGRPAPLNFMIRLVRSSGHL